MTSLPQQVDVLVVGGGPVGQSVGVQLHKAGIPSLVVERRPTLSRHPKANGVFSRTMEAFRQWGMSHKVAARGLPAQQCLGFVWTTRLNGFELGNIMFAPDVLALRNEYACHSPELPCFIPQDIVESLLADELALPGAGGLRLGYECVGVTQTDDEVLAELRDGEGEVHRVRAKYLVAADGSRSSVRQLIGIPEEGVQPWGESVNLYFESEGFERLRRERPYQLWWVVNADVRGAFWPVSHKNRWVFTPEGTPGVGAEYYTPEVCIDLIRKGAGEAVDVKLLSASVWQHEMAIASQWRSGRVFLAGDAAHRFPPHGGFGMNSGIQDAQNLGWKLIAVLNGKAGPGLLDSYEAERKPVAESNAALTLRNTELIKETGWHMPNPDELAIIELPEGESIRAAIAQAVPRQAGSIQSRGQQFGAVYRSSAVVSDGTEPPQSSVGDYIESGTPGARAPHLWITSEAGELCSVLDLVEFDRFTLLASGSGAAWREAASTVKDELRIELSFHTIGDASSDFQSDSFAAVYGLSGDGAVLVRPDGHVAWRSAAAPVAAREQLREALTLLLSREVQSDWSQFQGAHMAGMQRLRKIPFPLSAPTVHPEQFLDDIASGGSQRGEDNVHH